MDNESGQLVSFAKKVGIVFGAVIAAGTVIQSVGGFLWGYATKPIISKIEALQSSQQEERVARQHNDSLIVEQIAKLGEAINSPMGSRIRERAFSEVQDAPGQVQTIKTPNRLRRR